MWSQKRITKVFGFVNKVQSKFDLNCMLYKYHISWKKEATITITDANFPSINLNDILITTAHYRSRQNDQLSIRAYSVVINLLKDYVSKFYRSDIEFAHVFRIENMLAKISCELLEAQILSEGPIEEPELGYIYMRKKTNRKDFYVSWIRISFLQPFCKSSLPMLPRVMLQSM